MYTFIYVSCSQKAPQDVNVHLLTTSVPSIVKVSAATNQFILGCNL